MTDVTRPLLVGSTIGVIFGVVFFVVNAGPFGTTGSIVVRVVGVVVGVALLIRIVRLRRRAAQGQGTSGFSRGYWLVVLGEVVALVAGALVIGQVLHDPDAVVAWFAVVVGVHFVALARVWRENRYNVLGVAMTVLGVAGIVLAATTQSALAVAAVAGVGSGVALFVACARPLFAH